MRGMAEMVAGAADVQTRRVGFHTQVVAVTVLPWVGLLLAGGVGFDVQAGPFAALAVVNAMHVASSAVFYLDREARPILDGDRVRFFVVPAALLGVGLLVGWWRPWLLAPLGLGLAIWQVHHFTRQNVGMLAFWARSRGVVGPGDLERKVLTWVGYGAMIATLARRELIDAWPLYAIGLGVVLVAAARLVRSDQPWPAMVGVVFWLPLFAPIPTGTAVLAIGTAHAAQYWLMMLTLRGSKPRPYLTGLLAVTATAGVSHALAGYVAPWHTGLSLGLLASHFVVDAGFWKMRRPEVRTYMRERFTFL